MSLNMLVGTIGDTNATLYSPLRDLAYCYPQLIKHAAVKLQGGLWSSAQAVIKQCNVPREEIGAALQALVEFIKYVPEIGKEGNMHAAVKASGFLDVSPAAQVVVMAMIGQSALGVAWQGRRDVLGAPPPGEYVTSLQNAVHQAMHALQGTT